MRTAARGAALAALLGAWACVAAGGQPMATLAAFTDAEHSVSSELAALRLRPPQAVAVSCSRPSGGNGAGAPLTVRWSWPATGAPYTALAPDAAVWARADGVAIAPQPTSSVADASGVIETVFSNASLAAAADSGGTASYTVAVTTRWQTGGTTWWSPTASRVTVQVPDQGRTTCAYQNGA